jgi:hypothetical protein
MQFTTDSASVQEALRIISRLAPPTQGNLTLQTDGKKVQLHSFGELNQCSVTVPGTVKGSASFAISVDSLRDATKGRSEVDIKYKNTVLTIKGGAYEAELPTVDAMSLDDASSNSGSKEGTKIKISTDQASWLRNAVNAVALKPTALVSAFMPLGVKLNSKGAFVSCFDSKHMSFMSSNEITGDAEFCIPVDMMQGVLDAFGNTSFTMTVSESNVSVSNKLAKVILNIPHLDEQGPSLNDVLGKAKEVRSLNGTELFLPKEEVVMYLDNARAVAVKERGEIAVSSEKGKTQFSIKTVNGSIKATVKGTAKKNINFLIDFDYFDELVRKAGQNLELKVVGTSFLLSKTDKVTLLVAFNEG